MQLGTIQNKIYEIRGQKVMMDRDLAAMYEVETRVLNQAVRRNITRFPLDFMFQLTKDEFENWISQNVTSNFTKMGMRKLPLVFTEQGIAMLSSVLNSEKAIQVNIFIIRIFVLLRQWHLNYKEIQDKIAELEKRFDKNFSEIYKAINLLMAENQNQEDFKNRKRIGFKN